MAAGIMVRWLLQRYSLVREWANAISGGLGK